jgi:sporulation protein YlmC with PRC-barrel domain
MRIRTIFLTTMMIMALLLAACAGDGNQNGDAVGTVFPEDGVPAATEGIPETGGEPGDTLLGTATPEPTELDAQPTSELETATLEPTEQETADVSGTTPTVESDVSSAGGQGTGTGIIGIPETGSGDLAGLAAMFDFRVEDTSGNEIGTVRDYVINMCEANILYIVVDPAAGLGSTNGQAGGSANTQQALLIPYQATLETPNSGSVDAGQGLFVIDRDAAELGDAPTVDLDSIDLEDPAWDSEFMSYWQNDFDLSLTSACNVPVSGAAGTYAAGTDAAGTQDATMTPDAAAGAAQPTAAQTETPGAGGMGDDMDRQDIFRLALASRVLEAELQDGNGQQLGTVQDVAIVPETGRTQYLLVESSEAGQGMDGMLALPPGAVNVMYEDGSDQPVLVLLVETGIYQNAPTYDQNAGANDADWFDYWDQYLPMTMEQLP